MSPRFLLIFLMTVVATTTAGLPFACPKGVCTCDESGEDWVLECPYLNIEGNTHVTALKCERRNADVYAFIPRINLTGMTMFEFHECPLGLSFKTILDLMNVTAVHMIDFQSSQQHVTFSRADFDGLQDLQKLVIKTDSEEKFPVDMFDNLPALKVLQIESLHEQVPVGIFKNLTNLQALELALQLRTIDPEMLKNLTSLKMLSLYGNRLRRITKEIFQGVPNLKDLELGGNQFESFNREVFSTLRQLENLHLNSNRFTSLPTRLFANNPNLKQVKLVQDRNVLKKLPSKLFAGLKALEKVHISAEVSEINEDLFVGSFNLNYINLEGNRLQTLPAKLLKDQRNLRELNLRFNGLESLDDEFFQTTISLEILRLSNNKISTITDKIFNQLKYLVELYLDYNGLQTIQPQAFKSLRSLEILELQHNQLTFEPRQVNTTDGIIYEEVRIFSEFEELRVLNLRHNKISRILQDWRTTSLQLEELDLTFNEIQHITDGDLHFVQLNADIFLQNNEISTIDVQPYDYGGVHIHLGNNPLMCDCNIYEFVREISNFNVEGLDCHSPEHLYDTPVLALTPRDLLCPLDDDSCPDSCECQVRPDDFALLVNCSNANLMVAPSLEFLEDLNMERVELDLSNNFISVLPTIKDSGYELVSVLNVEGNIISEISGENVPEKIESFKLKGNTLKIFDYDVIDRLTKRERKFNWTMTLSSNEWICNCSTVPFRDFAFSHIGNILDWDLVTCADGKQLSRLGEADFCATDLTMFIIVIAVSSLLILILIVFTLYLIFKQEIKIWLYARGWCMCLIKEDERDENKKFDAFISFAQEDIAIVTEHLKPELESGEFPYKLCIHERDWVAGEMISDQVRRSVEQSRRTIVVLSKHFIESTWGRAEFDEAHQLGQKECRPRLIMIVYDEDSSLDMKNLPANIQSYINTNTYLRWGDPGFWPKLRYALRQPISQTKGGKDVFIDVPLE